MGRAESKPVATEHRPVGPGAGVAASRDRLAPTDSQSPGAAPGQLVGESAFWTGPKLVLLGMVVLGIALTIIVTLAHLAPEGLAAH